MYICQYEIDEKYYSSEVIANSKKEAVANALAMFGDSVCTLIEADKNYEECLIEDCKIFWVKGMKPDAITDSVRYDADRIKAAVLGTFKILKHDIQYNKPKEIPEALKVLINQPDLDKSMNLTELYDDRRYHDVVLGVFGAGMIVNHLQELDFKDALYIAKNQPEELKEIFECRIEECYTGSSYKNMWKAFRKYERQILTIFGFGMYAAMMINLGGLTDKAELELERYQKSMIDNINSRGM